MFRIRTLFQKINYHTLLKYFLSYFFLLSFLLLCFFFAFRNQIKNAYYSTMEKSIQEKLIMFQKNFNNDLDHVFNIHYTLSNNANLRMLRHSSSTSYYRTLSIKDMRELAGANPLISDIVYIDTNKRIILACYNYIHFSGDHYYLQINGKNLKLPVGKYGHDNINSLIFVENQDLSALLLFPNVSNSEYDLFYIINSQEIINSLSNMLSEEISSAYLTDGENNVISASGTERVSGRQSYNFLELQKIEENGEVIYTLPLYANLFLTVHFSKDTLLSFASRAFLQMYLIFAAICCAGMLLIFLGMKLTYFPLRRLGNKFIDPSDSSADLEAQLDSVFSSAILERKQLQEKIDKYHAIMKESILDTIVNESGEEITPDNLDRLFNGEPGGLMFVVKISRSKDSRENSVQNFKNYCQETLSDRHSFCILLEAVPDHFSFLIYYGGYDQDKTDVLKFLLQGYHQETGYSLAMSNGSASPLDIPGLYMNAMRAGDRWNISPMVFYDELDEKELEQQTYPYSELSALSSALQQLKFDEARTSVQYLLHLLDQSDYPLFYPRSVLTEILTAMITSMNQQNIRFNAYNSAYFEALYYIRSFPYDQKRQELHTLFFSLIDLFEKEMDSLTIKSSQLQDFISSTYTSTELSISMLAEKFHVSIAYMSYLFKKYFNENFSDYLWKLRVSKAKELLRGTSKPIEEICIEVGYENVSSFRRKFKKELGITPSQYRSGTEPVES